MKKTILSALLLGLAVVSFADTFKSGVKDETVSKWFHFVGDASPLSGDLNDPTKYEEETAPTCSSTSDTYRCDILIQTMDGDESQPDLSQPVQDQRKRTTTNP